MRRPDIAGWSSLVARRAHNPEVVGSNPAPATKNLQLVGLAGELFCYQDSFVIFQRVANLRRGFFDYLACRVVKKAPSQISYPDRSPFVLIRNTRDVFCRVTVTDRDISAGRSRYAVGVIHISNLEHASKVDTGEHYC